jgi:hypothetical protein
MRVSVVKGWLYARGGSNSSRSTTPSIRTLSASGACRLRIMDAARRAAKRALTISTHVRSCVDGHLYELDGRKKFPINHGPSSQDTLLKVCLADLQPEV